MTEQPPVYETEQPTLDAAFAEKRAHSLFIAVHEVVDAGDDAQLQVGRAWLAASEMDATRMRQVYDGLQPYAKAMHALNNELANWLLLTELLESDKDDAQNDTEGN